MLRVSGDAGVVDAEGLRGALGCGEGFDQFHAFQGNGVFGGIAAQNIAAFLEIPKAEFELFARHTQEIEKIPQAHIGLVGMGDALAVEEGQNFVALAMFIGEGRRRVGLLKLLALGLIGRAAVLSVILGATLRIAEGLIGVGDAAKRGGVARFFVIRMKTLGLHAIDAVNGFLIGVGADLEDLIVIDKH